jgi:hypothetical protein
MSESPLEHLLHIIRDARSSGAKIEQSTLRQEIVSLSDKRQAEAILAGRPSTTGDCRNPRYLPTCRKQAYSEGRY